MGIRITIGDFEFVAKRIGILPPKGRIGYKKITQTKAGSNWFHRYAMAATPFGSKEKAFRHVWHRRGDRRLPIFQFRITRDDGVILDHTQIDFARGIAVYQQHREIPDNRQLVAIAHGYYPEEEPEDALLWEYNNGIWYYEGSYYYAGKLLTEKFSYNTKTQIWTVYFIDWEYVIPRKRGRFFWASFLGEDTVVRAGYSYPDSPGEHPNYVYKSGSFYAEEDKIRPKFYEVRVPYYKETAEFIRTPSPDFPDDASPGNPCSASSASVYGKCNASTSQAQLITVESSIHYTINYLTDGVPSAFYYGTYNYFDPNRSAADTIAGAYAHWYYTDRYSYTGSKYTPGADYAEPLTGYSDKIFIPAWVRVTTSKGDISNNIVTAPIDSEEVVTPTPYSVWTSIHRVDAFYTGDDPYGLPRQCSDDMVKFPLTFEIFRLLYSIEAAPKLD